MNLQTRYPIRLLITGGTIDSENIKRKGEYVFDKTHLPEMIIQSRSRARIYREVLMLMDSALMSDTDRELIATKCAECEEKRIVITHGTSTMIDTAATISQQLISSNKVIVMTGSFVPFNRPDSDALFNLGNAIAAVQVIPEPGVYIAMNGKVFGWADVRKNVRGNFFQEND